jgi:predicted SAM-dependent methyltransferase
MNELLQDCKRALKPGGEFSACVPDARTYIDAYNNPEKYNDPREIMVYDPAFYFNSKIDYINYIAYLDNMEHKILFDPDNILRILELNGFKDVQIREPEEGLDPPYHYRGVYDSIFVKAYK